MHKLIFLDVGGPLMCARSAHLPEGFDPIAVELINRAIAANWLFVVSSDLREQFNCAYEAEEWFKERGMPIRCWDALGEGWRTAPGTNRRDLEIAIWMQQNDTPKDAIFLIIDDAHMPREFMNKCRMNQLNASSVNGLDYLSIQDGVRWFAMTDAELEEEFSVQEE